LKASPDKLFGVPVLSLAILDYYEQAVFYSIDVQGIPRIKWSTDDVI